MLGHPDRCPGGTFAEGDRLADAKTATFDIDRLGREYASEVDPREGSTRVTATDYFPSGRALAPYAQHPRRLRGRGHRVDSTTTQTPASRGWSESAAAARS